MSCPHEALERKNLKMEIRRALMQIARDSNNHKSRIENLRRQIIFLWSFEKGLTVEECAKKLNISPDRYRQIHDKNYHILRHPKFSKKIAACVDSAWLNDRHSDE